MLNGIKKENGIGSNEKRACPLKSPKSHKLADEVHRTFLNTTWHYGREREHARELLSFEALAK